MNNIQLLELISKKINRVRDEINELSIKTSPDDNYDLVFDTIVLSIISDLETTASTAIMLSEEIDTIQIN